MQKFNTKQWIIWFIQVFTWHKSFKKNPIIGSYFLNKIGLHVLRYAIAHFLFYVRQLFLSPLVSNQIRKKFKQDGYVIIPNFLESIEFSVLKNAINDFDGEYYEIKEGPTRTRRVFFNADTIGLSKTIIDVANNDRLLKLIRYASSKNRWPSFHIENIIHGIETARNQDPQKVLHSDCFHPTVKAWLFIDSVNQNNGPFTYVKSSNQFSWSRLKWEYHQSLLASTKEEKANKKRNWDGSFRAGSDDLRLMGYEEPISMIVEANSLVIANTHGFHCRGQANENASRMAIWMQCRDNPFNPFVIPSPKLGAKLFNIYRAKRLFSKNKNKLNNGAIKIKMGKLNH